MDLHSGTPYFWIRNGLPCTYPALVSDTECDVLIIGAGITGALCARACVEAGLGTVVLDGRSIGTGSTGASTALLQYEIDTPLHELAGAIGLDAAVRGYRLCAEAVEELATMGVELGVEGTRRLPSLQFASERRHATGLREEHALRVKHGFRVDLMDARELHALFGLHKAAALMSHTAAEIDPYGFTHAVLQDVIRRGGRVFDRSAMENHARSGDRSVVRTATGITVRAEHLIMATGYESQQYLAKPVASLNSTYAVASQRIERDIMWHRDCLIWETAQPYLYLRTTPDRRVIIGGLDAPFKNAKRRDALLDSKTQKLVVCFHELFPDIPFEPEFSWCGTFGSSKDGLPFIDRDERTGAWFVIGMGGNGITFSQVGARMVRDALLGKVDPDRDLFRFNR
ncbi:MAG: FAD-dependent oxidoreductase [Flavobacteriales bacterium]